MSNSLNLNQVIAIAEGEKSRKQKVLSKIYQSIQKIELFTGLSKTYRPLAEEDGERLPDEKKLLQMTVDTATKEAIEVMESMFNIIGTQDVGNQVAKANVSLNEKVVLKDVPVTYLIFLEKQLVDIETFISSFPTLDPAEEWTYSDDASCFKSKMRETHRTKKLPKVIVKYPATSEHPAQTELMNEAKVVGYWETVLLSGSIQKERKEELLKKVRELSKAIKIAREEANSTIVEKQSFGTTVLEYIFK